MNFWQEKQREKSVAKADQEQSAGQKVLDFVSIHVTIRKRF